MGRGLGNPSAPFQTSNKKPLERGHGFWVIEKKKLVSLFQRKSINNHYHFQLFLFSPTSLYYILFLIQTTRSLVALTIYNNVNEMSGTALAHLLSNHNG